MHHRKCGRKLNRTGSHRQLMFRNMVVALLRYTIIKTTLSKAKELRRVIEPIITLSKVNTLKNRRLVFSRIRDNRILSILFNHLGPHFLDRPGGYTRILKYGVRAGDHATMVYIELVDRVLLQYHKGKSSTKFVNMEK